MAKFRGVSLCTEKIAIDPANCTQICTRRIIARVTTSEGKRIKVASGIAIRPEWWSAGEHGNPMAVQITVSGNRSADHADRLQASQDFNLWRSRLVEVLRLVPRTAEDIRKGMAVASTMQPDELATLTPATFAKSIAEVEAKRAASKTIAQYLEDYAERGKSSRDKTKRKGLSQATQKAVQAVAKSWARFESATTAVNIADLNASAIQDYTNYIANEKPQQGRGRGRAGLRSNNTVAAMVGTLRTALNQITKSLGISLPDDTFAEAQREQYPTEAKPYLTSEEIATLAGYRAEGETGEAVRRAFVFQASTGVRFGDLAKFTPANINEAGALVYQSGKTATTTTVPLNSTALEALGNDWQRRGRLFALPTLPTYNAEIKAVLKGAGISRQVVNYNGTTAELNPIYEIASSHMARRSFVGRLVEAGVPAEVIQPMSGHTKGSKAFARYYNITDQQKAEAVAKL